MQLFLIIAYFVIIFVFVTPVPLGIRLIINNKEKKPSILIKIFNRNADFPKLKKLINNKSKLGLKVSYKKFNFNKIIIDNFNLEVATPKDLSPALNYSLFFLLNTFDAVLSRTFFDWYRDKSYITYVITDKEQIYIQFKADIKINLFMIFSNFFQTIKIYWRKNGSD